MKNVKYMHQPKHARVLVDYNEWVTSNDMGPWLSKSAPNMHSLVVVVVVTVVEVIVLVVVVLLAIVCI